MEKSRCRKVKWLAVGTLASWCWPGPEQTCGDFWKVSWAAPSVRDPYCDILEGRRRARASRSGSECLVLWASLSCAAPVAGSDKLRPTQNSWQHFRRCSGRQLRRPFRGRGRGITTLAASSHHSPFPMHERFSNFSLVFNDIGPLSIC